LKPIELLGVFVKNTKPPMVIILGNYSRWGYFAKKFANPPKTTLTAIKIVVGGVLSRPGPGSARPQPGLGCGLPKPAHALCLGAVPWGQEGWLQAVHTPIWG